MILVPSRRRIENLKRFFQSLRETETTSPGAVIVDGRDYADNLDAYFALEASMPHNWGTWVTKAESMGGKVRETWRNYYPLKWVCLLNDDHYALTHEWDKKLIAQLNGKNFVSCNDNWNKDLPAGATMWSGDLLRAVGYIFPPRLEHTFIDNLWKHLGLEADCWNIDMSVTVEHRHVDRGLAPVDDTHRKMQAHFHADGPNYLRWLEADAPGAIARIKALG